MIRSGSVKSSSASLRGHPLAWPCRARDRPSAPRSPPRARRSSRRRTAHKASQTGRRGP